MKLTVDLFDSPNNLRRAAAVILSFAGATTETPDAPPAPGPEVFRGPAPPPPPPSNVTVLRKNDQVVSAPPEHDSKGTPWDSRIHSPSKKKNADGSWRRAKNIDDVMFAKTLAEVRGEPWPPVVAVPTPPPPPPAAAPPAPPAPPAPAAAQPTMESVQAFRDVMANVAGLMQGGKLTRDQVTEACKSLGLNAMQDLIPRPDLVPQFKNYIDLLVGA